MINNTKRFILLQVFLFSLFPIQSMGQSEYAIKQKIQESLEEFMSMLSYVNDEEEVTPPSTIATRFSGGNYFRFNAKEMKLQNFIEDYCYSDLKRQIVNHSLRISPNNITKVSNNPSDQRWTVNGILKREYAINKRDNISDELVKFIILWRGINEEIGLLEMDFYSVPRISISNVSRQIQTNQTDVSRTNTQLDYSQYINKAIEMLEAGDCATAQIFYNIYKDLSGKSIPSVEAMMNDCKNYLHIGDTINVQGKKYTVAYLSNKKHGFAIRDIGVYSLSRFDMRYYLREQMIPTSAEMDTIYINNKHIGLTGRYWTSDRTGRYRIYNNDSSYKCYYYYYFDFLIGKFSDRDDENNFEDNNYGVLLLHRF